MAKMNHFSICSPCLLTWERCGQGLKGTGEEECAVFGGGAGGGWLVFFCLFLVWHL